MVKSSSYCPSRVYIVGNGVLGAYRSNTGDPGPIGRISESYCGPAIYALRSATYFVRKCNFQPVFQRLIAGPQ